MRHRRDLSSTPNDESVDWAFAMMERGFHALRALTNDEGTVLIARQRYLEFREQIDPIIHGAERIDLAFAASRIHRSGRISRALVIVTGSVVLVCSMRQTWGRPQMRTVILHRLALSARSSDDGTHSVELHADGRRLRLTLPGTDAQLRTALLAHTESIDF